MDEFLRLRNVRKTYRLGGTVRTVLEAVDFELRRGRTAVVTGPSGSGKTTFLNLIGALDLPDEGEVVFEGQVTSRLDAGRLAQFRNAQIGFVFQDHFLLPQLNAIENVMLPTLAPGAAGTHERAAGLLELVGLGDALRRYPASLSGGERQRVAIARALINGPALVLADEPTGNLDRVAGENAVTLLLETARAQNSSVIMATHNPAFVARFDAAYRLDGGELRPDEP